MDGRYAGFAGAKTGLGLVALFGCFVFVFLWGATLIACGQRHINTVFAFGRKNTVKSSQVHSGFRHQRGQLGDEIQQFEDHVRGANTVWRFELRFLSLRRRGIFSRLGSADGGVLLLRLLSPRRLASSETTMMSNSMEALSAGVIESSCASGVRIDSMVAVISTPLIVEDALD